MCGNSEQSGHSVRFRTTDILVIYVCNVRGRKSGTYGWALRDIRARELMYENQGYIILY
jgi:hypothetical protein